jgi:hypothetical protein
MARHKTIESSNENRSELYDKYVKPNHQLVRSSVSRLTQKKSEIDDNFQNMCELLLANIDTYKPEYNIGNWIITCCRRSTGKMEASKDSYVDATKGGEFEYSTYHEQDKPRDERTTYKNRWRLKKAKDFVNVYDDSIFKSDPNEMMHDGITEVGLSILSKISPKTNFGLGTYQDVLNGILVSEDLDLSIHFMMYFHNDSVRDISINLNIGQNEVRNALSRIKHRIGGVLKEL